MSFQASSEKRKGAVLPLFAILLPVLLLLCGFAINVAYMQLTRTELKVATDAGARAGGRAWSVTQDVNEAKRFARLGTSRNYVAGKRMRIRNNNAKNEIEFGLATRTTGRYTFSKQPTNSVRNGTAAANAIRIVGKRDTNSIGGVVPLMIGGVGTTTTFEPIASSTCIQLDRDVALVMDKSGSMAYPTNDRLCAEVLDELLSRNLITLPHLVRCLYGIEDAVVASWYPQTQNASIYNREYSNAVLNAIQNTPGILGTGEIDPLTTPPQTTRRYTSGFTPAQLANVFNYGTDINAYNNEGGPAPRFSRWEILGDAVDAFLQVFNDSPQEEHASLVTFSNSGATAVDIDLVTGADYDDITDELAEIRPASGTGIGRGMERGIEALFGTGGATPTNSRQFAAKTIVVLTDGTQTPSYDPKARDVALTISETQNVKIHTVTFSPEASQAPMEEVAQIGGGKHYHANTAGELVAIFREIANNLPTTMID